MMIKMLLMSVSMLMVLAAQNVQSQEVFAVDSKTPTELLDVASKAHHDKLIEIHQEKIEALRADGVVIITQDQTMSVEKPTRIAFDYYASKGQEVNDAKYLEQDIYIITLYPAKGASGTVAQSWKIDHKNGTATAQ